MRFLTCFILFLFCSVATANQSVCKSCDKSNKTGNPRENILNFYHKRNADRIRTKRNDPSTFVGHPKTREERWHANFDTNNIDRQVEQAASLVNLLIKVIDRYLNNCVPIILYDAAVERTDGIVIDQFFKSLSISYVHGRIDENSTLQQPEILTPIGKMCHSYILFLTNINQARKILGPQTENRIILIARTTQWRLQEFLSSKDSSDLVNLLVIGESLSTDETKDTPYVLYTHRLYTDGLGSNTPIVLTSWIKGKLSRPHVNLFPKKFRRGFSSHRFTIAAIHQPPFVIKQLTTDSVGNVQIDWDGMEIKIVNLLAKRLNFSYEIVEPKSFNELGVTYGIIDQVEAHKIDIGLAGAFVSIERMLRVEMSQSHSTDCAAFITLASKALPRYRAIMGPFQWPVWLAIILIYLFAIFPLTFSDRLTLRHLLGNWSEMENMFWYMFGTFTNSLTFKGEYSWVQSKKSSTRILIGIYWVFSIIITACYTSSIIAFVTLPVFPNTMDSIRDLLRGFYRIGTLSTDGWQYWFVNSSHPATKKLLKNLEFVDNVDEGLGNVTNAFFWGYAFIGSRSQLEYIIQNNFTAISKRSALHIGDECLTIFGVSMMFPKHSVYAHPFNEMILQIDAAGLLQKMRDEMSWENERQGGSGLLQAAKSKKFSFADVEERKLTLADTEGMFLLMALGYIVAGSVLVSEIVGGCASRCRQFVSRNAHTINALKSNFGIKSKDVIDEPKNEDKPKQSSKELWLKLFRSRRISAAIQSHIEVKDNVNPRNSQKKHKRSLSVTNESENIFGSMVSRRPSLQAVEMGEASGCGRLRCSIDESNSSSETVRSSRRPSSPESNPGETLLELH